MRRKLTVVAAAVVALIATGMTSAAADTRTTTGPRPAAPESAIAAACAIPGDAPWFTIGSHNTLRGAATFTTFAGIIGWQEVNDPADRDKMRSQLGGEYHHFIPEDEPAKAVPISWRDANFAVTGTRSIKVHDGREGVTPARYLNLVHLRHRPSGRPLTFINTHFISGAFDPDSTFTQWRLDRWNEHRARLIALLRELRDFYPTRPIFLVGDFNRRGYLDLSGVRVYPIRAGSATPIDHMYAGRPGDGDCLEQWSPMGSDHPRWRATAWLN